MERMSILLVDDDQNFLSVAKKRLAKRGHAVQTASNGPEVFEKLQVKSIHVVVLDVKMPGMSGIEILKEIKKNFPLVQVIMLTGVPTVGCAADSLKLGALSYLIKPVDIEELLQKIKEAYEQGQRLEQKIRNTQIRVLEQNVQTNRFHR
ncbi:MAG: response regulator [Desulfobacteraceae bacterium]|jgi:DNA-binding NtrC family response regulator|nr:response regulator [Desulfobacteraceae bacterium]MDH3955265.1 response regulator [Desulfobacteraceae bacterium]PLX49356.1 MAG: two-component system response regulator [Desulfobacteraceae bacterium]